MASPTDCTHNTDPLKLVRDGTSQEQRLSPALQPSYVSVNERKPEHGIKFAQAYSSFLQYYNASNTVVGDWKPFFSEDVSVQLAVAAVQDVEYYRQKVREYTDFLNDRRNKNDTAGLRDRLDYLFSCCATLSIRFNQLTEKLPVEIALKKSLQNLVQSQLAPALKRLIIYRKGGEDIADAEKPLNDNSAEKAAPLEILGGVAVKFSALGAANLSKDWTENDADWMAYYGAITGDPSVYGTPLGPTVFDRANHLATHNLFTSILDQFLKVYARTVSDAKTQLEDTFRNWNRHEPHYALFLAFLRLFEHAHAEADTLTGRHLDLYYREILRLKEKPAEPGHAHLLVELAKHATIHELKAGALFKAGKDDRGIEAFFANERDFVANQAKVAMLKTLYRHKNVPDDTLPFQHGRLFASPAAASDNGLGAKLTAVDQSWHPFYNKIYRDGQLSEIRMPQAEVGFAIASHYLWMAEGERTVTVEFTVSSTVATLTNDHKDDVVCLFTVAEGWVEKTAAKFIVETGVLKLDILLTGADPAIVPYAAKTHRYNFQTDLPVLLVKLRHQDTKEYAYSLFQKVEVQKIDLRVHVRGLRSLAVSNDFGTVDISKPFQPFGAQPVNGASFTVGSKEVFQKKLESVSLDFDWQNAPNYYQSKTPNVVSTAPKVSISYLSSGQWSNPAGSTDFATESYPLGNAANATVIESADLSENAAYTVASRNGYVRMVLNGDIGFKQYQIDLGNYLAQINPKPASHPGAPILGPFANAVSLTYVAHQDIPLNSSTKEIYEKRTARFFHVVPFGQAEQHPAVSGALKVYLFPQFQFQRDSVENQSEAEFYIGVTGLKPPQNLALLFQVADGTADPLSEKPDSHLHWSYLRGNEWITFAASDVEDHTGGLLNSGIVTFAMPRDASDTNTLLPTGMHWIRIAVASESDAVCRLILVAAQALKATFINQNNDPSFPAKVLAAGTITQLAQPDAAIKNLAQPFSTFGGRGAELPVAFYTRISERLRHKDRAIALWDHERLILDAFPQIYKAKCLNHTRYEPTESGLGIYQELAPGHVTIVTIPNQQFQNLRDPLRPYTSLGLLEEIDAFLRKRLSCFVTLHVKNPQFEEVRVVFKVRLHDGFDETYYVIKLQETLTRFLSPWAFPGGGGPSFGGKIYKSALINLVEEQSCVDYVTDFELFHVFRDLDGAQQTIEKNEVEGSKAVSILVSVPARHHTIQVIKPAEAETPGETCPCEA